MHTRPHLASIRSSPRPAQLVLLHRDLLALRGSDPTQPLPGHLSLRGGALTTKNESILSLRGGALTTKNERMLALQGIALRLIGSVVSSGLLTPENSLTTLIVICASILLRIGRRRAALVAALTAVAAHVSLPMLEQVHSAEGYGCASFEAAPRAPPQPLRGEISTEGRFFKDKEGRSIIMRGINVAGSSKLPAGTATHDISNLYDLDSITFVGRPFPLEEADTHLTRLRAMGLTLFRFIVTWEAVEHKGPGVYDDEYLDYIAKIVRKAGAYGINVWVDPHQDVWSRWSGGDGAPAWTLDRVGFNISALYDSGAAISHQHHGDPYPRMMWPSNHQRLATGTMFTLFFGGREYAKDVYIDGVQVQDFLQGHYIDAMRQVARALKAEKNVIGFDTLNEPNAGLIGWNDLTQRGIFRQGWTHSWYQAFLLGEGLPQEVEHFRLPFMYTGMRTLNAKGVRAWKDGVPCIWRRAGVWDLDEGTKEHRLLQPDHFAHQLDGHVGGGGVDFVDHFMVPFFQRFRDAVRAEIPEALIFIDPNCDFEDHHENHCPRMRQDGGLVWAPHWYDFVPLITKSFRSWVAVSKAFPPHPVVGQQNIVKEYRKQLNKVAECSLSMGKEGVGVPTIIGEFGIPFDINEKLAYRSGDFSQQISALETTMQAMDAALLSGTLWNYTPDNTNERGDNWNDEDLSVFSLDQIKDPGCIFSGGRALAAVIRPLLFRTAGTPLSMKFDVRTRVFVAEFQPDPTVTAPTIVFVPYYQYPNGYVVTAPGGSYNKDAATQSLIYSHTAGDKVATIRISPPAKEAGTASK